MRKYIFILGCKYDEETNICGLEQAYSTEEYAWTALDDMHDNYNEEGITDYTFANYIISTDKQLENLPNKCWYIRAIELL